MSVTTGKPSGTHARDLWLLATLVLFHAAVSFVYLHCTRKGLVRWPFSGPSDLLEGYASIAIYSPVVLFSALSLLWLRAAGAALLPAYGFKRWSWLSCGALAFSIAYPIYSFASAPWSFRDVSYWPPVLIMSALNSFAEETFYRLVLMSLLGRVIRSRSVVVVLQSVLYALPHYWIGTSTLAWYAFGYGLLMGLVKHKDENLGPCLLCHFFIDLAAIGVPFLALR